MITITIPISMSVKPRRELRRRCVDVVIGPVSKQGSTRRTPNATDISTGTRGALKAIYRPRWGCGSHTRSNISPEMHASARKLLDQGDQRQEQGDDDEPDD